MIPWALLLLSAGPTEAPWLERLPHGQSLGPILEQVVMELSLGVEESGAFSAPDAPRPSFLGDSWQWSSWYFDGHDVTDPLDSGQAAFTVPFPLLSGVHVGLDSDPRVERGTGLYLSSKALLPRSVGVFGGTGRVGDLVPGALGLTRAFSTTHPRDRLRAPPDERRGPLGRLGLYAFDRALLPSGEWSYGLEAQLGQRQFLTFAPGDGAFTGTYEEPWARVTGFFRLIPKSQAFVATVLAEAKVRDHWGAEAGFQPDETQGERRLTLHASVEGGDTQLSFTLTQQHTEATPSYSRELLDPDGQVLFPFVPAGDRVGLNFDVAQGLGLGYLLLNHRAEARSPSYAVEDHAITYGGEPYGLWRVNAETSAQLVGNHRLGIRDSLQSGDFAYRWDLYGSLAYGIHESGGNDLFFIDVGGSFEARWLGLMDLVPFVELSKTPTPLSPELVHALDRNALRATFGLGESRRIYETRGGAFIDVDPDLLPTNIYSAVLGLELPNLGPFQLTARGRLKSYENPLGLSYQGRATETVDEVAFLLPGEKRYLLSNRNADRPIYFALELLLAAQEPEEYLFQIGFLAYTAAGITPFGNGALANDLGVIDPSSANPNADRLGLANVDGDRAFVTKVAFAYRIWEQLWGSATLRHKDGQPFAFFTAHERDDQVAFTYHSNRGSPLKYERPLAGPREDFQINVDLALSYKLRLGDWGGAFNLSAFNLLDLGNTLQEVSGDLGKNGRVALEAQLPRTFYFGFELTP